MKRILAVFIAVGLFASAALAQEQPQTVDSPQAIFEKGYIQVVGQSEAGQTRFKANRSAKVLAQRELVEVIKGLKLIGSTTVSDGMLAADTIQTSIRGFLRNAVVVGEEYYNGEGFSRVTMRLKLRGDDSLYSALSPALQQPPVQLALPSLPAFEPRQASAPAVAPQKHDGLIVIVEGTNFKPALANRIITENNEVLFEPSKVQPKLLIERGCGGYTTTPEKAKALLASWGCKNPMTVTCTKVSKGTEAVVSQEDATAIFDQSQKSNMLPEARVVFVL